MEQQYKFLQIHDKDKKDIKWTNILGKGYRITSEAWLVGEQLVIQPAFAHSDEHFTAYDVLFSATVASDRGANERGVRLAKVPNFVKHGLRQNERCDRLADGWIVFGFQINFMYETFL